MRRTKALFLSDVKSATEIDEVSSGSGDGYKLGLYGNCVPASLWTMEQKS